MSDADRDPQHARHLIRLRDHFAVMTAIAKQVLGISLLKVAAAYLLTGNLGGDGQHGDTAAMAVVKAVDEVQIAWPRLPAQTAI